MKISFCIPTYNRCKLLDALISNIIEQIGDREDVEICISDNASTDGTDRMILSWLERTHVPIVYRRNDQNIGPDKNYLTSVELSSGEYCWLFGSDDLLAEGALDYITQRLNNGSDIYLFERSEYNYDFTQIRNPVRKWMKTGDKIYRLIDDESLICYYDNCLSVGGVFSYLSSIIVKNDRWKEINFDDSYIGTAYSHAYILMSIINNIAQLEYVASPLVLCRGDNDTFTNNGVVRRIEIDFIGYMKLANDFYQEKKLVKNAFLGVLLKERPWIYTSLTVAYYGNSPEKTRMAAYYADLGKPLSVIKVLYIFKPISFLFKNNSFIKKMIRVFR